MIAFVVLALLPSLASAQHGHGGSGTSEGGMMIPWLHFTKGDALYFKEWVPASKGAVVGAAIGLFLLAIVERWVAAMRGVMELWWSQKVDEMLAAKFQELHCAPDAEKPEGSSSSSSPRPSISLRRLATIRTAAPFIPSHDFARGAMQIVQSALGYALMLAVMTFHAGYIIAIIIGMGVGEVLFGRFARVGSSH